MNESHQQRGFTLVEMMMSIGVFALVIAGVMTGWLFIIYGERQSSIQDTLDLDVRMTLENIRRDLRLSSMSKMFFAPAGVGPYTAISMPIADPDSTGLIPLDANTNIIWDKTKIYSQYGTTMQFRITTITNRDSTLTDAQRQAQLTYIATNGSASGTYESGNASTRTLFQNLFTWNITANGAIFDGYSAAIDRDSSVVLGSVLLSPGTHSYKFTVVGKDTASTGYKLGLDTMDASPSGSQREMEKQTVSTQSGASAVSEAMTNGAWGGNYHLSFPATATGQYVTLQMENDRWEDENFGGVGAVAFDSSVAFDSTLSPMDYVVRLDGTGYTWTAQTQTGDNTNGVGGLPAGSTNVPGWGAVVSGDNVLGCAVRVLLRGSQMSEGNYIKYDGTAHYVQFSAGAGNLKILHAYIAECSSSNFITPDTVNAGVPLLFNGATTNYTMDNSHSPNTNWCVNAWPVGTNFVINRDKSYIVTYLVDSTTNNGNAAYWIQPSSFPDGGWVYGSYIIPASSNPTVAMATSTQWSAGTYGSYSTTNLYGVMGLYSFYPTNGTYQSAVYDTHQSAPAYLTMLWTADMPAGSTLRMKVRSADNEDMSDAVDWTGVTAVASSGSSISPGAHRYIQYQAELLPTVDYSATPRLKNVTVRFTGENKVVDIGGAFTTGPNYGTFEMSVDGAKLQKGVTVAMQVYQDLPTKGGGLKRLTSQAAVEVEPRNTGK